MKVKNYLRILFAASFVVALCVNLSVNASKSTGGVSLAGIVSKVDACPESSSPELNQGGRCNMNKQRCVADYYYNECDWTQF